MRHDSLINNTKLPFPLAIDTPTTSLWHGSSIRDMPHMWHDSLIDMSRSSKCDRTDLYETWLIHMRHDSFICDMPHMWHDSLIDMSRFPKWPDLISVWHDWFIWDMTDSYETWLIHMRHDSFIWDMKACIHTYIHTLSLTHTTTN